MKETEAASCLYNKVIKTFDQSHVSSFLQILRETKNHAALAIIMPNLGGEFSCASIYLLFWIAHMENFIMIYIKPFEFTGIELSALTEFNGPGLFPLEYLRKEDKKFLKEIEKGNRNNQGIFEGLNYDDEQTANRLVETHSSRDSTGWKLLQEKSQLGSGTWDRKELIQCIKTSADLITRKRLWWNPNRKILPIQFITRRLICKTIKRANTDFPIEKENLEILIVHTLLPNKLVQELSEKNLINSELEYFKNLAIVSHVILGFYTFVLALNFHFKILFFFKPNEEKIRFLYTQVLPKWTLEEEEVFHQVLKNNNNHIAAEIFSRVTSAKQGKATHFCTNCKCSCHHSLFSSCE